MLKNSTIKLLEQYKINLPESTLIKIEDGIRRDKELLVTIDASHYGFRNNNGVFYRHDTMRDDVNTFIFPTPKPIIEKHRPESSEVFGNVISATYKLTDYYNTLSQTLELEGLTSEEYIALCRDELLPFQRRMNGKYNGLAYVQVIGKLNHKQGIKKVMDQEFLRVSIGATPKRLICSECLQDQMDGLCEHYYNRKGNNFLVAEQLEYDELSFIDRPADPFGKIIRIHDREIIETVVEEEPKLLDTDINVVFLKDFFEEAEGKTFVCVDNICAIINEEEHMKKTKSLLDEFSVEQINAIVKSIKIKDEESDIIASITLTDEQANALEDKQFAIVQKTSEGELRRFPMHNEESVIVGFKMLDSAEDLTKSEKKRVLSKLNKAAKAFGISLEDEEETTEPNSEKETKGEETTSPKGEEAKGSEEEKGDEEEEAKLTDEEQLDVLLGSVKEFIGSITEVPEKLEDKKKDAATFTVEKNPVTKIFDLLKWYATDVAYASSALSRSVSAFLEETGKTAIEKGIKDEYDELKGSAETFATEKEELLAEVESLKDECTSLEEENKELNFELRSTIIDELVSNKVSLGILEDSEIESEKSELFKVPYNALTMQIKDTRKLVCKIKDSVNNKIDIKKVDDPTLTDSDNVDTKVRDQEDPEKESESISEENLIRAFKNLLK
jgi:hypothetical protein